MKARRGYALPIVLAAVTILVALSAIIHHQLTARRLTAHAEERRLQAIWLARSAISAGRPIERDVELDGDIAHVVVSREDGDWLAEVDIPGFGTAHIEVQADYLGQPDQWQETYDRAESE